MAILSEPISLHGFCVRKGERLTRNWMAGIVGSRKLRLLNIVRVPARANPVQSRGVLSRWEVWVTIANGNWIVG